MRRRARFTRPEVLALPLCLASALVISSFVFAAGGSQRRVSSTGGAFVSVCVFDHRSTNDPILFPGAPGRSYDSGFAGNTTTDAFSTAASLRNASTPPAFHEGYAGTSCGRSGDRSAYWIPTLVKGSNAYNPRVMRMYYRRGDISQPTLIRPLPSGLRMIAGNRSATTAQSLEIVAWTCTQTNGTVLNAPTIPACASGATLNIRVRFPNCWNGNDVDSPDHKSHMEYSTRGKCPSGYPVPVPQLTMSATYRGVSGPGAVLACGNASCANAEFFNGWDQAVQTDLVGQCVAANVNCAETGGPGGGIEPLGLDVPEVQPAPPVTAVIPPPTTTTTTTAPPEPTTTVPPTTVLQTTTTASSTTTTTAGPAQPGPFVLDPSFDLRSKSNPSDYRQHVDFDVVCKVSSATTDDPIVFPGVPGASHMHVFTGNTTANAFSTQQSLDAGGTNCLLAGDRAAYWMPQLYDDHGSPLVPYHMRAYYRAGSLNAVSYVPHGLRMVAGNAMSIVAQDKKVAGWQCRSVSPDVQTVPKQATIPTCASTDLLEGSVVFPNCWDGVNLDSPDHKSHMSYSWADGNPDNCDAAHPVQVPQLTIAYRYRPGTTNSGSYLSAMHSGLTLHADFWNAWNQPTLDALVDRCINAGVHCGDVSPSHFPGPMP
jgi:hypothetical protein